MRFVEKRRNKRIKLTSRVKLIKIMINSDGMLCSVWVDDASLVNISCDGALVKYKIGYNLSLGDIFIFIFKANSKINNIILNDEDWNFNMMGKVVRIEYSEDMHVYFALEFIESTLIN